MGNTKTKEMFESISSDIDNQTNLLSNKDMGSLYYKLDEKLVDEGLHYDNDGVYIPLNDEDYKLRISRNTKISKIEIEYNLLNKKGKIIKAFTRKVLPIMEDISSEGKNTIIGEFKRIMKEIGSDDNAEMFIQGFKQVLNQGLKIFTESDFDDGIILEDNNFDIDAEIYDRVKPYLTPEEIEIAKETASKIKEQGLFHYLNNIIKKFYKGETTNIIKKFLGGFSIMLGKESFFFITTAHSEEGKSLEDDIVFNKLIPERYIFHKNSMTEASFLRYSEKSQNYFDRQIVLFGDLGAKNSFEKLENVFDIIKILITENKHSKDLTEGGKNNKYDIATLNLEVDSIGAVFQTTENDFWEDDDGQYGSRALEFTPNHSDKEEVLKFRNAMINNPFSKVNIEQQQIIEEIEHFHLYLLYLVDYEINLINPYGEIFVDFALKQDDGIVREFDQLSYLFQVYCILTYYDCEIRQKDGEDIFISSEKQAKDFISNIKLKNTLIPYEYDFIVMLKNKLPIIKEEKNGEVILDGLNIYFNTVVENDFMDNEDILSFDEIPYGMNHIDRLMAYYKLGGRSDQHKEDVFFTVSDLKSTFSRNRAYKNIKDVGKFLNNLYEKDYLGKLEGKYNGKNIYYLTSKCEEIDYVLEVTDEHREKRDKIIDETFSV